MNRAISPTFSRQVSMLSRLAAATVGAYGVTSLLTAAITLILPGPSRDAATAATMIGLLAWATIVMAVVHARSAMRAWIWLSGAAIPLGLAVWLLLPGSTT